MSPPVRRFLALFVGAAALLAVTAPVAAGTDDDAALRAAAEIAAARDRANQAAEDYFAAESELDQLEVARERLEYELELLAEEVAELKRAVEVVALNRVVSSGSSGIPILTDLRGPTEQLQGDVLASVVAESGATTLDDFDEARSRMRDKQDELAATEADIERQQRELLRLQAEAEAEVDRLRAVEAERLENEAIRAALEAQQREEARRLAELERRQAESRRQQDEAATTQAPAVAAASSSGENTGNQGASGGSAGGRTGGGGTGSNPRAGGTGYIDGQIVCPVFGTSAYGDTWGAPRSGGRRHQGVDMLAPTGTPLQAVIGGIVSHRSNRLGGVTLSLMGDNGNRYYYAHLSAYEGLPGRVEQGQIVGYIGDTGNATGVPHLHFELRPNNGVPINPYPSVRSAGC